MSTNTLPPPPAGYTVDVSALPPPPAGYSVDAPIRINAEGMPVYSVTSKQPSTWDRMVTAYGEFVNPLGEPTPGESFDERFKKVAEGLSRVPLEMSESASGFGNAVLHGDLPGAAHHLVGLIPFIGPGAQQVEQDVREQKWPEAIAHTLGLITLSRPDLPQAGLDAAVRGVQAAPRVGAGIVEGVKAGAKASVEPATLKVKGIPVEIPGAPAILASTITGATTGHYIPGVGGIKGAAIGATVPFARGFYEGYRRGTSEFDAAGRVGETRTPVWEQGPPGEPPAPGGAFIGPLQQPRLPSGRVPGRPSDTVAGLEREFGEWLPQQQGATLRDVAQQTAPPAGAQTLSDIAAAAAETPATTPAAEGGAPLSEVAKPKPKRGRKPKAGTEPAPLSAVAEAAEATGPTVDPTVGPTVGPTVPTVGPTATETTVPEVLGGMPKGETYRFISQHDNSDTLARKLFERGTPYSEVAPNKAGEGGWSKSQWDELRKDVLPRKKDPLSPDTVDLTLKKLAELETTGEIAPRPQAQLAQALYDAGVTDSDTHPYSSDQWKQAAEAAGVPPPKPDDLPEIRGRIKQLITKGGKIDIAGKMREYLASQGIDADAAAKFKDRQWENYANAAGLRKLSRTEQGNAIADLRRNPPGAKAADLAATLKASIDAASEAKDTAAVPAPETTAVRERALQFLDSNRDQVLAEYQRRFGNVLNADNAAELFPDYSASIESRTKYRAAVHPAAQAVRDELFQRAMADPAVKEVVFTAGGNGAGKTASAPSGDVVMDSTLSNPAHSARLVGQALDSGKRVVIAYAFRPIEESLAGVLDRAKTEGRTVSVDTLIRTHEGAAETASKLFDRYADNPNVEFRFIDNSGTESKPGTIALTKKQNYRESRDRLYGILESQRPTLSKGVYEASKGSGPGKESR